MRKQNRFLSFIINLFKEKQYLDVRWMRSVDSRIEHLEYLIDKINSKK